jgi:GNAT superfamily N-acetyltransferase
MTTTLPTNNPSGHESTASRTARSADTRQELLRDGTRVVIRPIRPEDTDQERHFIETLSPRVRRFRFLDSIRTPSAELLRQMTVVDPATGVAYVAVIGTGQQEEQIGVARFSAQGAGTDCEFAVAVSDAWQSKGLGTLLMQRLIEQARARGLDTMHSSDASDNDLMRRFAAHLHMQHQRDPDDATMVLYSLNVAQSALSDSPPARDAAGS